MGSVSLQLQAACRRIHALPSWSEFFKEAQVSIPTDAYLCRWLRRAVINSLRKRYHRGGQFERIAASRRWASSTWKSSGGEGLEDRYDDDVVLHAPTKERRAP